ncbi:unnamed protein product [Psylliodes chrysocephalus]|uniref:Uncharacterized protein n=1 Tax=Psylliodes chrysocephalus TaxID=3402493 RepID=A0A9P0DAE6_9CUCU|nr:unnamed protein product [Psylliodes chrysocephala]
MPKQNCSFTAELQRDFPFFKKVAGSRVKCDKCTAEFCTILNMEKSDASVTDVVMQMIRLKTNLQDRLENKFIPHGAKQILKRLEGDLRVNINELNEEIWDFYRRAIQYLDLWKDIVSVGRNIMTGYV